MAMAAGASRIITRTRPIEDHFNVGTLGAIFGRGKIITASAIDKKIAPSMIIRPGREG